MKKPSAPSLIGSLISYIALLPGSLSRIQQSIQKLIPMNTTEMTSAVNAMRLEVVLEMRMENKKMRRKGVSPAAMRMGSMLSC